MKTGKLAKKRNRLLKIICELQAELRFREEQLEELDEFIRLRPHRAEQLKYAPGRPNLGFRKIH